MNTSRAEGVLTITVRGDLQVSTGQVLSRRLGRLLLEVGDLERIELDLSGVEHLDVAAMHAIVRAAALARGTGRTLVVRRPSTCVLRRLAVIDPAGRLRHREPSGVVASRAAVAASTQAFSSS